jgi:hypothetical protein
MCISHVVESYSIRTCIVGDNAVTLKRMHVRVLAAFALPTVTFTPPVRVLLIDRLLDASPDQVHSNTHHPNSCCTAACSSSRNRTRSSLICQDHRMASTAQSSPARYSVQRSKDQISGFHKDEHDIVQLPPAYLRLTWQKGHFVYGIGESSDFLSTGLLLRFRWRVGSFLWNDSHADVYSLRDIAQPGQYLECRWFLRALEGNWNTYAKRKIRRMQKSEHYLQSFPYRGRHMLVIPPPEGVEEFQLKNVNVEFPKLVVHKRRATITLQTRSVKTKPTYAAVFINSLAHESAVGCSGSFVKFRETSFQERDLQQRILQEKMLQEEKQLKEKAKFQAIRTLKTGIS